MVKKVFIVLFFIGIGLVVVGLILTQGDFTKFVNAFSAADDYEYIEMDSDKAISKIKVNLASNSIVIHKSEDETIKVNYYESDYEKINVTVENGLLFIEGKYKFRLFNFGFKPREYEKVNIYLPNSFEGEASIDLTSGKLSLENFKFKKLDVNLTSGNLDIKNINVDTNLILDLTSGDARLENINVTKDATFNFTSGSLIVSKITAKKISADLTSGSAKLSDVVADHLICDFTSGDLDVSIIGSKNDYAADLSVTSGNIIYDGMKLSNQKLNVGKDKTLTFDLTSGDMKIEFKNN